MTTDASRAGHRPAVGDGSPVVPTLSLLLLVFFAVLVAACGDEEGACGSGADCAAGEVCVGFGLGDTGACETPCDDQLGCPTGKTCVEGGNSCPGCEDITYVCRDAID